jgi:hypothetical protein
LPSSNPQSPIEADTYQAKVCEKKLEKLIQEFDMQEDFARHRVIRPPDLTDVDQRVHSREEGTVEPSPTL